MEEVKVVLLLFCKIGSGLYVEKPPHPTTPYLATNTGSIASDPVSTLSPTTMRVHVQALAMVAMLATASAFQVRDWMEGLFLAGVPAYPCPCSFVLLSVRGRDNYSLPRVTIPITPEC